MLGLPACGHSPGLKRSASAARNLKLPGGATPPASPALRQKLAQMGHEHLWLVVVQVVTGLVHGHHPRLGKVLQPAVMFRVGGPALGAVHEQYRALDDLPQVAGLDRGDFRRAVAAYQVVILPTPLPILGLAHALFADVFGQLLTQ